MRQPDVVIAGGGAAGFFAAIVCAESAPDLKVTILERTAQLLSKVRISGGGRCNVTHACFDARRLSENYPRGGKALLGPFASFQPRDTVAWFESRGVKLKTEPDGRMFPVTDSSQSIVDCLRQAADRAGVEVHTLCGVERVERLAGRGFVVALKSGDSLRCGRLMLATGGCRGEAAGELPVSLGHSLEPPVPSLFTFHIGNRWLHDLAGNSVESVEVSVPGTPLRERGALLVTHVGLSGPVILRLSAWGARALHGMNYKFPVRVNWVPGLTPEAISGRLDALRAAQPARLLVNAPLPPLPLRLWESLVLDSGIPRGTRLAELSRAARHQLVARLGGTELQAIDRTLNQDEFVTCGGVELSEVSFKTMESRICPGLHFGGELLDIDGLTGGFNFQAAWTTGWLAGRAMAAPASG